MKWKVDEDKYKKACREISKSDLKDFKRHPDYIGYVGNDVRSRNVASDFHDYIIINYPRLFELMDKFKTNDIIGNPKIYELSEVTISPGTLRFIKVVGDLSRYFGTVDDLDIVEIGAGYGGQCKIIHDAYKPEFYTIVDIIESLEVSKKYLEMNKVKDVFFLQPSDVANMECDLVISDYALSEFDDELLDYYIDNIVKNSKYGYFTVNIFNEDKLNEFVNRLERIYSEVILLPENPKTSRHNNHIIIGR